METSMHTNWKSNDVKMYLKKAKKKLFEFIWGTVKEQQCDDD